MSKIPPKFEQFLAGKPDEFSTQMRFESYLLQNPPNFGVRKGLNKMGHKLSDQFSELSEQIVSSAVIAFQPKEVRLCQVGQLPFVAISNGYRPFPQRKGG
jgi:hypothetical protein